VGKPMTYFAESVPRSVGIQRICGPLQNISRDFRRKIFEQPHLVREVQLPDHCLDILQLRTHDLHYTATEPAGEGISGGGGLNREYSETGAEIRRVSV
jgi:hypothetical protein